ncbi:MAG: TetR/AcrR family transcriptional regulator [Pseudomonadota bacterium]
MDKATTGSKAEAILHGAMDVLLSEGLPHVSYDRVAQAAGVTRQLVRYHYPSHEALMLAVCEHLAATYREVLIASVSGKSGTERLGIFFDFYFDLLEGAAKPRDDQIYDALLSLSARSDQIRTALRDQYQLLGTVLSHEIRQVHLSLPMEACEELAYLLITIMYGHWKMVATLGMGESHKHIARRAMDRLLQSYLEDPTPQPGGSVLKP